MLHQKCNNSVQWHAAVGNWVWNTPYEACLDGDAVLAVSFSRQALSAEFPSWQSPHQSYYDDELGLDFLDESSKQTIDIFWIRVQFRIEQWIAVADRTRNFTDVMMLGESANERRFRASVFKAVRNRTGQGEGDFVVHLDEDVPFTASRGAAEMAKGVLEARAGP